MNIPKDFDALGFICDYKSSKFDENIRIFFGDNASLVYDLLAPYKLQPEWTYFGMIANARTRVPAGVTLFVWDEIDRIVSMLGTVARSVGGSTVWLVMLDDKGRQDHALGRIALTADSPSNFAH